MTSREMSRYPVAASAAVAFDDLHGADLLLDATCLGGTRNNTADDPIGKLVPVGNQGGFRYIGAPVLGRCRLMVLYTSGHHPDWPDTLDRSTGRFVYYGDNKSPGRALHDTPRRGNAFLRDLFAAIHSRPPTRKAIPPILIFEKAGAGRSVVFRGLAVPGAVDTTPLEDLVAVWKTTGSQRFQNYRAVFTVLDCGLVTRGWLDEICHGESLGINCPDAWRLWIEEGIYHPLRSQRTLNFRDKSEQLPESQAELRMVEATVSHFSHDPYQFEACAAQLWRMSAPNVSSYELTQRSSDGGRDAVGLYALGPIDDPIQMDFALEAKCYRPTNAVGVHEVARLISRLRHRQFGVLVTTSYLGRQAYSELREDRHPVVVMAARDVVETMRSHDIGTAAEVKSWLEREFPLQPRGAGTSWPRQG